MTKIGSKVFSLCIALKEINLPDSIKSIGECTFSGCKSLVKAKLPKRFKVVMPNMFDGCSSLRNVRLSENTSELVHAVFRLYKSERSPCA